MDNQHNHYHLNHRKLYCSSIDSFLDFSISTPLDVFSSYCRINLIQKIVTQTIIFPPKRGNINFSLTKEMICFIEILLVSGYHRPIRFRRLYWSNQPDVCKQLDAEFIRRNRCEKTLQCVHFADNSRIISDRYCKIRPLFTEINRRFKTFPLGPDISMDKTMIKYYEKHGSKQFIRGKPIKFGFKMFSFAAPDGYLY